MASLNAMVDKAVAVSTSHAPNYEGEIPEMEQVIRFIGTKVNPVDYRLSLSAHMFAALLARIQALETAQAAKGGRKNGAK